MGIKKHAYSIIRALSDIACSSFEQSLTAIVLMPVKSVTVADPPRISIEETIMFVASLIFGVKLNHWDGVI
jgi:hypothetical protein